MSFRAFALPLFDQPFSLYTFPQTLYLFIRLKEYFSRFFPSLFPPSFSSNPLSIDLMKGIFSPALFCSLFPHPIPPDLLAILFSCSFILSSEILSLFGFHPISLFVCPTTLQGIKGYEEALCYSISLPMFRFWVAPFQEY